MSDTKLKVLFVDDEPEILNGLRLTLRKERKRMDLLFAGSGEEALATLEKNAIDVVCTDLQMPGINGCELLGHMLDTHPGVGRIVISGHADDDVALRALSLAHRFLVKPAGRDAIVGAITEITAALDCGLSDDFRKAVGGTHSLFPQPNLLAQLVTLLGQEDCDMFAVTTLVEQDPAIAAKLLQFANSKYMTETPNAASVSAAVELLGQSTIESIVSLLKPAPVTLHATNSSAFQMRSLLTSRIAGYIARDTGLDDAIASTAGLLADTGLWLLENNAPELAASTRAKALAEDRPLFEAQALVLGVNQARLGGALLSSWGLPDVIIESIQAQFAPVRTSANELELSGLLHVARYLANQALDQLASHQDSPPQYLDLGYIHATAISTQLREWSDFTCNLAEEMLKESDNKAA